LSQPASRDSRPSWDRDRHLRTLADRVHDLIVVGGGATGCSVARDAALRGLDVCLVERSDLGSGASSRSTRFIHGGLRYLRTYEFGFVREGLHERAIFLAVAPHLVRPIPFLFPVYRNHGSRRWSLRLGIGVYDLLAGGNRLSPSRSLSAEETLGLEPRLRSEGLAGSVVYTDAITDDARLVIETAVAAVEAGAKIALHVEVVRIVPSDSGPAVLLLKDRLTGTSFGARAAGVVNATGVWPAGVVEGTGDGDRITVGGTPLRPTRGSHLVVARETLPVSRVVVMPSRRDGRILFAVPAGEFTYLGTTEAVHTGSFDEVRAETVEVDYIREVAGEVFRSGPVPRDKVLSTWAGLRPLIERPRQATATLSRDFRVLEEVPGIVAVAGGKLTTCRRMAEAAVDLAASILARRFERKSDPSITRWKLFPGAEGTAPAEANEIPKGIDPAVANHLLSTYGSRATRILRLIERDPATGVPFAPGCAATPAEVAHAVDCEGAIHLSDLLFRRFHPHLIEARMATTQGRTIAVEASKVMASKLDWNERRRVEEIDRVLAEWRRDFSVPGDA